MIDQPGAVDRDDAIWVVRAGAGWRAWVHVADVARVVRLGSTADVEACRRGHTRYLPDRTQSMLSPADQAAAALRPNSPIPTCVIGLTVDSGGELVEFTVEAGRLAEPLAVSYQQAAQAVADSSHRLQPMLSDAYELAQALLARRRAAGALAVYDLLRGWATDEDGQIVALATPERNAGYLIVQELMIAANEAAARWAVDRELPILFRNHRVGLASRGELADQLAVATSPDGSSRWVTVAQQVAMVLRPAVYEPQLGGHFGLNLPAYTHATSPLRRYPDLVNQRILLAAAAGRASPYQLDTLEEVAAAINLRQEAQRARRSAGSRVAAQQDTRVRLAQADYRQLDDGTFGKLVRLAVAEQRFSPVLAAEIGRRVEAGRLLPREAATVLLGARGHPWLPLRQRLLRWLVDEPAHALTTLSLYGQREFGGEVRWQEQSVGSPQQPLFTVLAQLGEFRSPLRSAPSKRAARQQAALGLVAVLAELSDPSGDVAPPAVEPSARQREIPVGHPPVMAVNELAQLGQINELRWSYTAEGASHEPTHRCTVSIRSAVTGQPHQATGAGASKAGAKAAAAAALWRQLLVSGELSGVG